MIRSLFRLSLRMATSFVQSLIKLCGLDWTALDGFVAQTSVQRLIQQYNS